ncbi:MAG: GDSL-type esterase/lipase family protein [Oscillospiraceae bacterium]
MVNVNEKPKDDVLPSVTIPETVTVTEATTVVTEPPILNPVTENLPKDMSYFNNCAFVGDSLTVGLSSYGIIPESNVFASVGMNIDKINKETIKTTNGDVTSLQALKNAAPKNIYIMLGSNGIAWLSNEIMIKEYGAFIDSIQAELPSSSIYILSIPPVSVNRETAAQGKILNSDIDLYNSELLKMSNEKKLNFVDINTALKGNDGKMPVENVGKDGMHFKKDTYTIMLNYILKHTVTPPDETLPPETTVQPAPPTTPVTAEAVE